MKNPLKQLGVSQEMLAPLDPKGLRLFVKGLKRVVGSAHHPDINPNSGNFLAEFNDAASQVERMSDSELQKAIKEHLKSLKSTESSLAYLSKADDALKDKEIESLKSDKQRLISRYRKLINKLELVKVRSSTILINSLATDHSGSSDKAILSTMQSGGYIFIKILKEKVLATGYVSQVEFQVAYVDQSFHVWVKTESTGALYRQEKRQYGNYPLEGRSPRNAYCVVAKKAITAVSKLSATKAGWDHRGVIIGAGKISNNKASSTLKSYVEMDKGEHEFVAVNLTEPSSIEQLGYVLGSYEPKTIWSAVEYSVTDRIKPFPHPPSK